MFTDQQVVHNAYEKMKTILSTKAVTEVEKLGTADFNYLCNLFDTLRMFREGRQPSDPRIDAIFERACKDAENLSPN